MKNWTKHKPKEFTYSADGRFIDNWFSNMVLVDIIVQGRKYKSVEHFYQSMAFLTREDRQRVREAPTAYKAKRIKKKANNSKLRELGEPVKLRTMEIALIAKFSLPEWKEKLIDTGDSVIIEWNNWKDQFWGVTIDDCFGSNHLGELLMGIRKMIK